MKHEERDGSREDGWEEMLTREKKEEGGWKMHIA